ncbi:MAG: type II toxin-antitoxin system Phd/YefM family antitoxin [Candidatus Dadabacteria bacterium]|nr:type II toxin-antitoxin system Phd/YefM family antitoxin [Candidatus Dadabacteria bacterium]
MTSLSVTEACEMLAALMAETAKTHKPILITGKESNAVLVSESDWNAIAETLHLLSVPGMKESIKKGMEESAEKCVKKLDW